MKQGGFVLGRLLDALDEDRESPLGRAFTRGEIAILRESKLRWRLRWSALRRTDEEGNLVAGLLSEAVIVRRKRFPLEAFPMLPRKPTPNPGSNWLSIGPRNINGRIRRLAVHPERPDTIYAASAAGGVWKTEDGGRSWRATMHEETSLATSAVALDPSDPSVVYAGTGEPVYVLSGPGEDADMAWWYEGAGILKSTDGGGSWSDAGAIGNQFVYAIAVDPQQPQTVVCAGYSAELGTGGLCRSTDGGASWTTVISGVFTDVLFDPANPGRAYAGQHGGGVLKSTDHGATWQPRNEGLPAAGSMGRISLTLAAGCPNVLYAQVEDAPTKRLGGIYRSATAAEGAWTKAAMPGVFGRNDRAEMVFWCSFIAADPTDETGNTVWSGGMRVARSTDGGQTWRRVTSESDNALPHVDQQHAAFVPGRAAEIVLATDGGVFRGHVRADGGVDWSKASAGLAVTQFYDIAWSRACPSMVGGGAQDNGSLVTAGGRTWRQVLKCDGGYMGFHPTNPYVLFAQEPFATYRRSDDGGRDFYPITSGLEASMFEAAMASVLAVDESEPDRLFAGTNHVHRTTTGGRKVGAHEQHRRPDAWTAVSQPVGTVTEIAIAPSEPKVVYAGTIDGRLHRSLDGTAAAPTFHTLDTPQLPRRWLAGIAVHPADPHTVYVSFLGHRSGGPEDSDHVWKGVLDPTSSEVDWQLRAAGLPNVPVGAVLVEPANGHLYAACDIGVYRSTDDGASWAPFDPGLPNVPVVDLALDPDRRILYAATHGRGAYKLHLDPPFADVALSIRDNLLDTGDVRPAPEGVPNPEQPDAVVGYGESPDIKVFEPDAVPDPLDGIVFDAVAHTENDAAERIAAAAHIAPRRGNRHRVGVQVHNFGWRPSGSAQVRLLWAPVTGSAGGQQLPRLPQDFWSKFPANHSGGPWNPIGAETVGQISPETPWVALMDWEVPTGAPEQICLLAIVDGPDDEVAPESERDVAVLARKRRQVAYRVTAVGD